MNRLRQRRLAAGMTQSELASRAGISRTAVTSIEGERLVPSVEAALALSKALGTTVETLFGDAERTGSHEVWAWPQPTEYSACWRAEVMGRSVLYPVTTIPSLSILPDGHGGGGSRSNAAPDSDTLVMASCDPAAGFLATQYAVTTGMRLITLQCSSRAALELLRQGLVHVAGLHLATRETPNLNIEMIRQYLGDSFPVVRLARWQAGIALSPTLQFRSVRTLVKSKANWIGREIGSGARECMKRLLGAKFEPRCVASNHRGVAEAVKSGWADAGICTELVSAEANLRFVPIQEDYFDICFSAEISGDRRMKAFINVIRSAAYRKLIAALPGYDSSETGDFVETIN